MKRVFTVLLCVVLAFSFLGLGCADPGTANPSAASSSVSAYQGISELTFRNNEKLQDHFRKHGAEVGCATAEEYLAAANAVIANPQALHKHQAEDGDDVYFLEATGELVIVAPKGYIRTYYLTDRGYFDRQ